MLLEQSEPRGRERIGEVAEGKTMQGLPSQAADEDLDSERDGAHQRLLSWDVVLAVDGKAGGQQETSEGHLSPPRGGDTQVRGWLCG